MICIPHPPTNAVAPPPSGDEQVRRRHPIDQTLDAAFVDLANDRVERGLLALLEALAEFRETADRREWRRLKEERWPRHPISDQLRGPRLRAAAMRAGGPRSGLAALLSLVGDPAPPAATRSVAPTPLRQPVARAS